MTTSAPPKTSMRRVHEYLQIGLEILGILLVAAGLGVAGAWLFGWAGGLIVSGATVLTTAYLGELRLNPPPPKPPAEPPPVTYGKNHDHPEAEIILRSWGRFAWLSKD